MEQLHLGEAFLLWSAAVEGCRKWAKQEGRVGAELRPCPGVYS